MPGEQTEAQFELRQLVGELQELLRGEDKRKPSRDGCCLMCDNPLPPPDRKGGRPRKVHAGRCTHAYERLRRLNRARRDEAVGYLQAAHGLLTEVPRFGPQAARFCSLALTYARRLDPSPTRGQRAAWRKARAQQSHEITLKTATVED